MIQLLLIITYNVIFFAFTIYSTPFSFCQSAVTPHPISAKSVQSIHPIHPLQISESPPIAPIVNEIFLAQGLGGRTLAAIRNYDAVAPFDRNGTIHQSQLFHPNRLQQLEGDSFRATYVSTGRLTGTLDPYAVFTFGSSNGSVRFPNIVIPMYGSLSKVYGHPFSAFPNGTNHPASYDQGELRTALGDFMENGRYMLAVAQGIGSRNGLVRIFEYTGEPAPNGWVVRAQFQPLDDVPTRNNANGGVTLAAGDVDGDGRDELLAGQTNSDTSLTQFTVIDLDDPQNPIRHNYTAFPEGFRGDGGVELCVADLDGDKKNEIIAANKGRRGDEQGNRISVIIPLIENQKIIGFERPTRNPTIEVMIESQNPGGGLFISTGEFDGIYATGQEIIIGSGEGAPQSFYHLVKLFYLPTSASLGVLGRIRFLTGSIGFINQVNTAFSSNQNPSSGAVAVASAELYRWHYAPAPGE